MADLKIYPTAITLEKNPDINAKEKIKEFLDEKGW